MLYLNTGDGPRQAIEADRHEAGVLRRGIWIDLVDPTDAERSVTERATGLRVPARDELVEIESSSRLAQEDGALYLSVPLYIPDTAGEVVSAPLGIVVNQTYLMTVRYTEITALSHYAQSFAAMGKAAGSVVGFVGLLEAMVERLADVLEHLAAELDGISRRVFRPEPAARKPAVMDRMLRASLRGVGRVGDRLSNLRDSLIGLQRIVQYATETVCTWLGADLRPRMGTLRQDVMSLMEYDTQLSNKVQFVLDATLGFINIEQNNSIKVLTVVSVVGVPPTLVASIYGMNFKNIPELDWHYGYYYGLGMVVLTALLPLIWFKRKGWI